jgi:tRNA(Ile2) C34 agmatinyltransferase TiaS
MSLQSEEQSNEVVHSIIFMLSEKFTDEKCVTVQRIFDKYSTRLVKGRDITLYLYNIGIIEPRREGETPKEANLWKIDMDRVREFLKNDGAPLDYKCPLCGSGTISRSYDTYKCTRCLFKGDLPERPFVRGKRK